MKFTPTELADIAHYLEHAIAEGYAAPPVAVQRLHTFVEAELADVIESSPDTIEMYFTNGFKLANSTPSGDNPFERGFSVVKSPEGKL